MIYDITIDYKHPAGRQVLLMLMQLRKYVARDTLRCLVIRLRSCENLLPLNPFDPMCRKLIFIFYRLMMTCKTKPFST